MILANPRACTCLMVTGLSLLANGGVGRERTCSYTTYKWNVPLQRSVERRPVRHAYADLAPAEVDSTTGCTVCSEDQVDVRLSNGVTFRACRVLANAVAEALEESMRRGEWLETVTGYRVGMTKGDVDRSGNRTVFSNHAYGSAIDVNERHNGLYERCPTFGPACRLIRGGPWLPGEPGSLLPDSPVVQELAEIGFRWGGTIPGQQKDFMHFSRNGY